MRFGLEGGKSVILDRVQATTDTPIILKQHAITFDRSADLQRATNTNHVAEQPGVTKLLSALSVLPDRLSTLMSGGPPAMLHVL